MSIKRIIFDTETTGLLSAKAGPLHKQPYMTEIYGLKVDEEFNILDTLSLLIKVPVPLTPLIVRLTGITDEMLQDQPTFKESMPRIKDFLEDADELIAHNLPFDRDIVKYQFKREDEKINFPAKMTCTIQRSMSLKGRKLNLQALHKEMMGEGFTNAHRAENDVLALVRCYHQMLEKGLCS